MPLTASIADSITPLPRDPAVERELPRPDELDRPADDDAFLELPPERDDPALAFFDEVPLDDRDFEVEALLPEDDLAREPPALPVFLEPEDFVPELFEAVDRPEDDRPDDPEDDRLDEPPLEDLDFEAPELPDFDPPDFDAVDFPVVDLDEADLDEEAFDVEDFDEPDFDEDLDDPDLLDPDFAPEDFLVVAILVPPLIYFGITDARSFAIHVPTA
jgi:hypothetical protein